MAREPQRVCAKNSPNIEQIANFVIKMMIRDNPTDFLR
jgi:hypothetical protein